MREGLSWNVGAEKSESSSGRYGCQNADTQVGRQLRELVEDSKVCGQ